MPRENLGPWMKLYADVVERKAHYNDRQFRALIEVWVLAQRSPTWGELPSRRALEARLGRATIGFLFDQGDLSEALRNDVTVVVVTGWSHYQARSVDSTNAERQRRWREAHRPNNALPNTVTSSASDNGKGPRVRDPLREAQREAYIERYGPTEVYDPKVGGVVTPKPEREPEWSI